MANDIQPGDVVVASGAPHGRYPRSSYVDNHPFGRGEVVRVSGVHRSPHWQMAALIIEGKPGMWGEVCFTKMEAADEKFVQQIRACKPIKVGVEA